MGHLFTCTHMRQIWLGSGPGGARPRHADMNGGLFKGFLDFEKIFFDFFFIFRANFELLGRVTEYLDSRRV